MPPRGGETEYLRYQFGTSKVSIHAPTRSATLVTRTTMSVQEGFNPRTHEECDLGVDRAVAVGRSFNPRTHEECDPTLRR